jgi:hypothetical protein
MPIREVVFDEHFWGDAFVLSEVMFAAIDCGAKMTDVIRWKADFPFMRSSARRMRYRKIARRFGRAERNNLSKSRFAVNPKLRTRFKHLDHGANYL